MSLPFARSASVARPTFSRDFAGLKTLDHGTGPAITFTRGSDATYFNAAGTLTTATTNEPRFDHSATGSSLGLLIEEARTNLLLNSATLATQTVTVAAAAHTLSFYGTGQIVLSGTHSATVTGNGAFPARTTLTFTPSVGSLTLTVTGTVEYAQLEAGSFATSYITTTGASATRAADSAVVTPISSFYNQSEGTLFAESTAFAANNTLIFSLSDKTTSNRMRVARGSGSGGNINFTVTTASVVQINQAILASSLGAGTTNKVCIAYKTNDFAGSVNGLAPVTNASASVPTVSQLTIGSGEAAGSNVYSGYIRKVAYWPRRLSNALLQQLTT